MPEDIIDQVFANPIYLVVLGIVALFILFRLIKKFTKIMLFVVALAILGIVIGSAWDISSSSRQTQRFLDEGGETWKEISDKGQDVKDYMDKNMNAKKLRKVVKQTKDRLDKFSEKVTD